MIRELIEELRNKGIYDSTVIIETKNEQFIESAFEDIKKVANFFHSADLENTRMHRNDFSVTMNGIKLVIGRPNNRGVIEKINFKINEIETEARALRYNICPDCGGDINFFPTNPIGDLKYGNYVCGNKECDKNFSKGRIDEILTQVYGFGIKK